MQPASPDPVIVVQPIAAAQTLALRSQVLREGRPVDQCTFDSDLLPSAFHAGALADGRVVGVGSVHPEAPPWDPDGGASWRLRGMATDPDMLRRGVGRQVLQLCIDHIQTEGGTLLWCNARTPAMDFYRDFGMQTRGEEFEIPGVGPHYVMWMTLPAA